MNPATLVRFAILFTGLTATAVRGQVITASLEGSVLDPAGAAVPGAKVHAINTSTNLEVRTVTDADGRYTFPSLPPGGPYSIKVVAAGFNTEDHTGITLEVIRRRALTSR